MRLRGYLFGISLWMLTGSATAQQQQCSPITVEADCLKNKCDWDSTSRICSTVCRPLVERDCLTAADCKWDGIGCSNNIPAMTNFCSQFDAKTCVAPDCYWDSTNKFCKMSCMMYFTDSDCNKEPQCMWDMKQCIDRNPSTGGPTCSNAGSITDCTLMNGCTWDGKSCIPIQTINNDPCFNTSRASCSLPDCQWHDSTSECYSMCMFVSIESTCALNPFCVWDPSKTLCNKMSSSSCGGLSRNDCNQQPNCNWNSNGCSSATSVLCSNISDLLNCNQRSDCQWDAVSNSCIITECSMLSLPECAQKPTQCTMISGKCAAICSNLSDVNCGKNIDCDWNQMTQVCSNKMISCNSLGQNECQNAMQCMWDANTNSCNDYTTPVVCYFLLMSDCNLNTDCDWDQSIQMCMDKKVACSSLRETECMKKPLQCMWDINTKSCADLAIGPVSCYGLSMGDCSQNKSCDWEPTMQMCMDKKVACSSLRETECMQKPLQCMWDINTKSCTDSAIGPVSCYGLSMGDCSQNKSCDWEPTMQMCLEKQITCSPLQQLECMQRPLQCMWDINTKSCMDLAIGPVSCYGLSMGDCSQNKSCDWEPTMQMCMDKKVACSSLRETECMQKPLQCMWDINTKSCMDLAIGPVSCYGLSMGDCSQNKSCDWEPTMQMCLEKQITCSPLQQLECMQRPLQCMWDINTKSCMDLAIGPVSCYGLSRGDCSQNKSCDWDQSIQMCMDKKVACSSLRETECMKKPLQCMWDINTKSCADLAIGPISCYGLSMGDCAQKKDCNWDAAAQMCMDKKVACSSLRETECMQKPMQCMWDINTKSCMDLAIGPVSCYGLSRGDCSQNKSCDWEPTMQMCMDKKVACSSLRETECMQKPLQCMWDINTKSCADSAIGPVSCYGLSMGDCSQNKSCDWDQSLQMCMDKKVACSSLRETECMQKPLQCMWDINTKSCADSAIGPVSCYGLSSGDCSQNKSCDWDQSIQMCMDKIAACSSLGLSECMQKPLQCMWDTTINKCSSKAISPVSCYGLSRGDCSQNKSCDWDQSIQMCMDKKVACSSLRETECMQKPLQCMWDINTKSCADSAIGPVSCYGLSRGDCSQNKSCDWDQSIQMCMDKIAACSSLGLSECMQKPLQCMWDTTINKCSSKAISPVSCYGLSRGDCAQKKDCNWDTTAQMCMDKKVACSSLRETECMQKPLQCMWDINTKSCGDSAIGPISCYVLSMGDCAQKKDCDWDQSLQMCMDKKVACSSLRETECMQKPLQCMWDINTKSCADSAIGPVSCYSLSRGDCAQKKDCDWDQSLQMCMDKKVACSSLRETECMQKPLQCMWDINTKSCADSAIGPVSCYSLSRGDCAQKKDCDWDQSLQMCMDKKVACSSLRETECMQKPLQCMWDINTKSCGDSAIGPISCYVLSMGDCAQKKDCDWDQSLQMCMDKKVACSSLRETECMQKPLQCMWDINTKSCADSAIGPVSCYSLSRGDCAQKKDCDWDQSLQMCMDKKVACSSLRETECMQKPLQCMWDINTKSCMDSAIGPVSCYSLSRGDCAQKKDCEWEPFNGMCIDSQKIGCDKLQPSECMMNIQCTMSSGKCGKKLPCISLSLSDCSADPRCEVQGTYCVDLKSVDSCNKKSNFDCIGECEWSSGSCQSIGPQCSVISDMQSCESDLSCSWNGIQLQCEPLRCNYPKGKCQGAHCQPNPKNNKCEASVCNALSESDCKMNTDCQILNFPQFSYSMCGPSPGRLFCTASSRDDCEKRMGMCSWDSNQECRPVDMKEICSKLTDKSECLGPVSPCDWMSGKCIPYACYSNNNEQDCNAAQGCSWASVYCERDRAMTNPCPHMGIRECHDNTRCGIADNDKCTGCSDYDNESTCTSTRLCGWETNICTRPPGCSDMQTEADCLTNGCYYDSKEQMCRDAEDRPPCSQYPLAKCLTTIGCRSELTKCIDDTTPVCSTLSREKCNHFKICRYSRKDKACVSSQHICDKASKDECRNNPSCVWSNVNNECFTKIEVRPCTEMTTRPSCELRNKICSWHAGRCEMTIGCSKLPNDVVCGKKPGCDWDVDRCVRKGNKCNSVDLSTACDGEECEGVLDSYLKQKLYSKGSFIDGAQPKEVKISNPPLYEDLSIICTGDDCDVCKQGHHLSGSGAILKCDTEGGTATLVLPFSDDKRKPFLCGKNGEIKKPPPTFADDCSTNPCPVGPDLPTECFDPDTVQNGIFNCKCRQPMKLTKGVGGVDTCSMIGVCSLKMTEICKLKQSECQKTATGTEECIETLCDTKPCPPLSVGCKKSEERTADGKCLLFPCENVCEGSCNAELKLKCRDKSREEGKHFVCVSGQCEEQPCRLPACVQPPAGCIRVKDDRKDAFGCFALPCGKLECSTDCSSEDEKRCATQFEKRMKCIVGDLTHFPKGILANPTPSETGENMKTDEDIALCLPIDCPPVQCKPPPGCTYAMRSTASGNEDFTDNTGCPKEPCGELVCKSKCNMEQRKKCCNPRKRKSECKECIVDSEGAALCIEKPCDVQAACAASPGCSYEAKGSVERCNSCGSEICEVYNACDAVKCKAGKECKVITNILEKATLDMSNEHDVAVCVRRRSGSSEVNDCSTKICPTGTTCTDMETRPPRCVSSKTANCGGCDSGENCEVSRNNRETKFLCNKPEDKALCDLDACACSGSPCKDEEQCHVMRNKTAICFQKHPEAPSDIKRQSDRCSKIICRKGNTCSNSRGVVRCRPDQVSPCRGVKCTSGEYCDDESGECIQPACDPSCEVGKKCVHTEGVDVCVAADRCKKNTWTWFKDTCIGGIPNECGEGRYCPPVESTDLSGCVSEYCECDPLTGEAAECSPTCHPVFRYCSPDVWSCDVSERDSWEPEQSRWCCFAKKIGCAKYNCHPTGGEGPELWTSEKKKWCCKRTAGRIGCEPEGDVYNCYSREDWSFRKHKWCCENKNYECPAPLFDCRDTRKAASWDAAQKKWCCENRSKGCPEEEVPKYNCTSRERWSRSKRAYCCNEFGLACENKKPLFDCEVTEGSTSWEADQKSYCCRKVSVGCNEDNATEGPFECEGSFNNTNNIRRRWCCANQRKGCKTQKYCDRRKVFDSILTEGESNRCCSTQNMGCKYQCPSDPLEITKLTQSNPRAIQYCCEKKGIGCPEEELEVQIEKERKQREKKLIDEKKTSIEFVINFVANWDTATENPKEFARTLLKTMVAGLVSADPSTKVEVGMKSFRPLFEGDDGSLKERTQRNTQEIRTPFSWETDPVSGYSCGSASDYHRRVDKNTEDEEGVEYRSVGILQSGASTEGGEAIQSRMTLTDTADGITASTEALQKLMGEASSGAGPLSSNNEGDTLSLQPVGGKSIDVGLPGQPTPPPSGDSDDDMPAWVYIIISLGAVCIAGTAIAVFVHSKRRNDSGVPDAAANYSFSAVARDTEMLDTNYQSTPSDSAPNFAPSRATPGVVVGRI